MFESIGPVWDGNEVWLVVAGGATFAAFPVWYATMFSGFYIALLLLLVLPDRPRRLVRMARARARARAGGRPGRGRTRSAASASRCSGASRSRACSTACRSTRQATSRATSGICSACTPCSAGVAFVLLFALPRRGVPHAAHDRRAARPRRGDGARGSRSRPAVARRPRSWLDGRRRRSTATTRTSSRRCSRRRRDRRARGRRGVRPRAARAAAAFAATRAPRSADGRDALHEPLPARDGLRPRTSPTASRSTTRRRRTTRSR